MDLYSIFKVVYQNMKSLIFLITILISQPLIAKVSGGINVNYGYNLPFGPFSGTNYNSGFMDVGRSFNASVYLGTRSGIGVVLGGYNFSNFMDMDGMMDAYGATVYRIYNSGKSRFSYGGPFIGMFYGFHLDNEEKFALLLDATIGTSWFAYPQIHMWSSYPSGSFTKVTGQFDGNVSFGFRGQLTWHPVPNSMNFSIGFQLYFSEQEVLVNQYRIRYSIQTFAITLGFGFLKLPGKMNQDNP